MKKRSNGGFMKLQKILMNAQVTEWCPVDTKNEFNFNGNRFRISKEVDQYEVHNTPQRQVNGDWNNWTNESIMDRILCIDNGDEIRFFDQNIEEIEHVLVQQV